MSDQEMVVIGQICGTHGYRGEVKVLPLTDFPERFKGMKEILVETRQGTRLLTIDSMRQHKQYLLMKLVGIDSKENAMLLNRGMIMVDESDVHPLPEGTYYIFQLIGLAVEDQEHGLLGKLVDVIETSANDVYVVQGERFGEVLIPALKQVILNVDLAAHTMQVKLLPGLIDEKTT
ncbi:MAG: ribosome maturation factor RimM [Acidobacteriota bacterium]